MAQPHVVVFPYDEQGHVTPALALARALASRGVRATGVLTATRYALFSPASAPPPAAPDIQPPLFRIEAIPDSPVPRSGADVAGAHVTDEQLQEDICFDHSLQKLEPGLQDLLQRLSPPPSCLISDYLCPWTQDLADRLGLPRFQFSAHASLSILITHHVPKFISNGLLPFQPGTGDERIDFIPGVSKELRLADVPVDSLNRDSNHLEVISRLQRSVRRAAGIVLSSTVYELEADFVDSLSAEGISVYTIGPMAATDWKGNLNKMPSLIPEDEGCLRWLDCQPCGAVVYVALGSLVSLTEEEIEEVALGLEAREQPFLWVLRHSPTAGFNPVTALPVGFQERTKERGLVIAWAPQAAVLAHASIGCFLSHCGISSLLEALRAGVPIIGGFGKVADLNTNLWVVTELWGVGVALLGRDPAHPLPIRSAVETRVREMIHGDAGKAISQNVERMKAAVRKAVEPNGSSHRSLSKLVERLQAADLP